MNDKNKKEIVTIANYQKLAMRTCTRECKNKDYAIYGFYSEQFELLAKINGLKAKQIRGDSKESLTLIEELISEEIGDCFWFIALDCSLKRISFEDVYKSKIKKQNSKFLEIKCKLDYIKDICKIQKVRPLDCMRRNIKKLAGRKQRGKIKGNGDCR